MILTCSQCLGHVVSDHGKHTRYLTCIRFPGLIQPACLAAGSNIKRNLYEKVGSNSILQINKKDNLATISFCFFPPFCS